MLKRIKKQTILNGITTALIVLWIYAAGSKLSEIEKFYLSLNLQPFPKFTIGFLVYAIPYLEILAAILLVFPKTKIVGLYLSITLLGIFSIYIGLILMNFWSHIPCNCGGILESMGWKTHLIFNLSMLMLTIYALALKGKEVTGKT